MVHQMESVYLETTVISYLVARPSRDLQVAAHQQTTHEWWETQSSRFDCCISQAVVDEISNGDPDEVRKRLEAVRGLTMLATVEAVNSLTKSILKSGIIRIKASQDAVHVAVASVHEIDYLLTWNCKHLANAQIMRRIGRVCETFGKRPPIICTPDELFEDRTHD